jgi:hypothetical protein
MTTPSGMRLIGAAEDVMEVPEEIGAGYLSRLLNRLAWISQRDLTHAAVLGALEEVTRGREQQGMETVPYDTGLIDQAQDVTEHVPASIASRTLYTLLFRMADTSEAELTHRWIAEQTARAVRQYRESDAVKAARARPAAPVVQTPVCTTPVAEAQGAAVSEEADELITLTLMTAVRVPGARMHPLRAGEMARHIKAALFHLNAAEQIADDCDVPVVHATSDEESPGHLFWNANATVQELDSWAISTVHVNGVAGVYDGTEHWCQEPGGRLPTTGLRI